MARLVTSLLPALLLGATSAQATLIDMGSITRDLGQNLDWLDPSETAGMSVPEALAANPDWRLATSGEVCGFVAQAEPVPALQYCGIAPNQFTGTRPWGTMLSLWGLTFSGGSDLPYTGSDALGLAALSEFGQGSVHLHVWALPETGNSGTGSGAVLDDTYSHPDVGVFLVRVIPEPSTSLLVGLGLGLLGFARSRHRHREAPRVRTSRDAQCLLMNPSTLAFRPIPEPSTALLLGLGLLGLWFTCRGRAGLKKFSAFTLLALVLTSGAARSTTIVINNGLAPPNPENVIDDLTHVATTLLFVRNEGCGNILPFDPCPSPGAPTTVALIDGGAIGGNLEPRDTSVIVMSGGSIGGDLNTFDSSTTWITGGSIGVFLQAGDLSSITLSGGSIGDKINAFGSSTLTIVGASFEIDGVPVGFGAVSATTGVLTGVLASGDALDNVFSRASEATIVLVPEPSTALLIGSGVIALGMVTSVKRRSTTGPPRRVAQQP